MFHVKHSPAPLTTNDTNDPLQLRSELATIEATGLLRSLSEPLPAHVHNFSSNDYLGLAAHPQLRKAYADPDLAGAGASRLIGGNLDAHRHLERKIAAFEGADDALLFSSGYQANTGAITALAGRADAIYSDALNHASIVDGCRLSGATIHIYQHANPAHLETLLATGPHYRRRLIITDTVFSMDGDFAPLLALATLAKRHRAALMVDEAHATGIYGPAGAGLCAALGIQPDIKLTTFGKALGSFGAAISGSSTLISYLLNRARPFIYTTALPPAVCAATSAALDLLTTPTGDQLRSRLFANARHLATRLHAAGLATPTEPPSPIFPLILHTPEAALQTSAQLLHRGFFVQAIRPPTVPKNTSRLRITASAAHTAEQIDALIDALIACLSPTPNLSPKPPVG